MQGPVGSKPARRLCFRLVLAGRGVQRGVAGGVQMFLRLPATPRGDQGGEVRLRLAIDELAATPQRWSVTVRAKIPSNAIEA